MNPDDFHPIVLRLKISTGLNPFFFFFFVFSNAFSVTLGKLAESQKSGLMSWTPLLEPRCVPDVCSLTVVATFLGQKHPDWHALLKHIVSLNTPFTKVLKWAVFSPRPLVSPVYSLPASHSQSFPILHHLPSSFLWETREASQIHLFKTCCSRCITERRIKL